MANERYNRLNNSAPVQDDIKARKLNVPTSAFPWNHIHSGQAMLGACIPIACEDVVLGEHHRISLDALLELRNPTVRRILNGCRVQFHAYYGRNSDQWEGYNNYITKGRSGAMNLKKPELIYRSDQSHGFVQNGDVYNACTPMSLMDYMGIPIQSLPTDFIYTDDEGEAGFEDVKPIYYFKPSIRTVYNGSYHGTKEISAKPQFVDALPFMLYQRIWRDFYSNKNLLQNNKYWFPDNDDHFILSYGCERAVCVNYENEDFDDSVYYINENIQGSYEEYPLRKDIYRTNECNNPSTQPLDGTQEYRYPNLAGLKFRQFKGDMFSTALPFPDLIRGDKPVIDLSSDANLVDLIDGTQVPINGKYNYSYDISSYGVTFGQDGTSLHNGAFIMGDYNEERPLALRVNSQITQSDLWALDVLTTYRMRMALTDGSYNEMMESMFNRNPHTHDRKPTYIGGCYQDIVFNSVTQTSASDENSPLGSKAGQGISNGSGYIGEFTAPDNGWIMIIMSIVPDVYYTQGIDRKFTRQVQEEEFFPIFQNLAPTAILNEELYISGNPLIDKAPFAYRDRDSERKSKRNRVSGLSALSHDDSPFDSALVMQRRFNSTPQFNNDFLSMVPENLDLDVFSFNSDPQFDFSVGFNWDVVSPMAYTAVPGDTVNLHA